MAKFKESDLNNYPYQLPQDWKVQCDTEFQNIRDENNLIQKDNFEKFLKNYLATCPQEMANTVPGIDEFLGRYSGNQESLTELEFQNFWRETYLVLQSFLDSNK